LQIRRTDRVYVHKYIPGQRLPEHDWRQYDRHTGIHGRIFFMLHFAMKFSAEENSVTKSRSL